MAEGCNEKFDFAFVKWILLDGRSQKNVTKFKVVVKKYPDKTISFKESKAVKQLYEERLKNLL